MALFETNQHEVDSYIMNLSGDLDANTQRRMSNFQGELVWKCFNTCPPYFVKGNGTFNRFRYSPKVVDTTLNTVSHSTLYFYLLHLSKGFLFQQILRQIG